MHLNQMSHRYVSGVLQSDWNDPSTSAHLIDRSEDVIFELVWFIKRSTLSFPVYITKKKVKSLIDSAVLYWTTWLMVFPRNAHAGFGRCYLVSTRHEILTCIRRNLTGTRLNLTSYCVSVPRVLTRVVVVGDSPRGELGRDRSIPVSTLLPKSVAFFIINIFLVIKMLSKLKSGKCWTRLASYPLQYGNWPWWNNPPICKDSSEENGTGQYAEPQERGL